MGRPVRFRLHIDHIDNPHGDVWAVRYGRRYVTAHEVRLLDVALRAEPVQRRQPRAFLSGRGCVTVLRFGGRVVVIVRGNRHG